MSYGGGPNSTSTVSPASRLRTLATLLTSRIASPSGEHSDIAQAAASTACATALARNSSAPGTDMPGRSSSVRTTAPASRSAARR